MEIVFHKRFTNSGGVRQEEKDKCFISVCKSMAYYCYELWVVKREEKDGLCIHKIKY